MMTGSCMPQELAAALHYLPAASTPVHRPLQGASAAAVQAASLQASTAATLRGALHRRTARLAVSVAGWLRILQRAGYLAAPARA